MEKWISKNTTITTREYDRVVGISERCRQEWSSLGIPFLEIESRTKDFEQRFYGARKTNQVKQSIENFTMLTNGEIIHDALLARRMGIKKSGKYYFLGNIPFILLTDEYPNNHDILKSPSRVKFTFSDAIILMLTYNGSTLTIAYEDDAKGIKRLSAFVNVGDLIYDFSKNLIMDKKDYFNLYGVEIYKIYSCDEYKALQSEVMMLISEINKESTEIHSSDIYDFELLCWPEEILATLTKLKEQLESPERK